jgi:outer membrane protein OmpA-like peptidoglycan-associated protein
MYRLALIACLLSPLAAPAALAQTTSPSTHASTDAVREYRTSDAVDPREVAEILGRTPGAPAIKMRSIRLLDGAVAAPALAAPAALSLPVQFAFDSAEILPAARRQLDALAEGIRLLPEAKAVVIEGHTDAIGTAEYNEQLSLRRAEAVKHYLVASHRVDAQRLRTVGLGEKEPRPRTAPNAAQNRRVQFRGE